MRTLVMIGLLLAVLSIVSVAVSSFTYFTSE
jgi:hypothetical protein